jgi:hypothetical protein
LSGPRGDQAPRRQKIATAAAGRPRPGTTRRLPWPWGEASPYNRASEDGPPGSGPPTRSPCRPPAPRGPAPKLADFCPPLSAKAP